MDRQTSDKVIPMCRYASQAQKKNPTTLEKMTAQVIFWIRIYSQLRKDIIFSANVMYMVSF